MKNIAVLTTKDKPDLLKKWLGFLFFIFFILGPVRAQADISSGLAAWWPFNEGHGYEANDNSGNGYNIWIDGPNWAAGEFGQSLTLDGTNPNLKTSTSINLSSATTVTVSLWLNHTYTTGANAILFSLGNEYNWDNQPNAFTFYLENNNPSDQYSPHYYGCDNQIRLGANQNTCFAWPSNGWHYYVAIFNSSGGNTLYIDGVLQNPSSVQMAVTTSLPGPFKNRPFYLMNSGATGQIEDVHVYNRALTSDEMQTLYNLGVNPPNPAGAPDVSVTAPVSGSTVAGKTVTISTNASGNTSITAVQFLLNGKIIGNQITSAPYSLTWDSTTATNGNYLLTAQAFNSAGQMTTAAIPITVSNPVVAMPSPSTQWPVVKNIVTNYGAKGDAVYMTADTVADSTTITIDSNIDSNYSLTSADVGKVVELFEVGQQTSATTNMDLLTTIVSVTDSRHAVLGLAPGKTAQAARCLIGTNNAWDFDNATGQWDIPGPFQQAVNDVANGNSSTLIYVPAGQYLLIAPQFLTANFTLPSEFSTYPAVTISTAGINFTGEDRNRTILLGNGACMNYGSNAGRGDIFWVSGPISGSAPIEFSKLTMDGGVPQGYRAYQYWPASTTTGDGWDVTHDALLDINAGPFPEQILSNITLTHWRGEILKSVTSGNNSYIDIENSSFIDGDADSMNLSFKHTINNDIFDNVVQAEEFWMGAVCPGGGGWVGCEGDSIFENSTISNATNGFALTGADSRDNDPAMGSYTITNNTIDVSNMGIYFAPATRLTVSNNRFLGGWVALMTSPAGYQSIPPYGDYNHEILVEQNYFQNIEPIVLEGSWGDRVANIDILNNMSRAGGIFMGDDWGGGISDGIISNNYADAANSAVYMSETSSYPWIYYDDSNNFPGVPSGTAQTNNSTYPSTPIPFNLSQSSTHHYVWNAGSNTAVYSIDNSNPSFIPANVVDYLNPSNPPVNAAMTVTNFATSGNPISLYLYDFILTQPTSQAVLAGQSATFTVSASGNPTYQWQQLNPGSSTWTNAVGTSNQASYTTAATTTANSGTQYQCAINYSSPFPSGTTNTVTLTVDSPTTPLSFITQLVNETVEAGKTAAFTAAASETGVSYQWYESSNYFSNWTWTAISGATSSTYTTPATALSDSGKNIECVVTDASNNTATSSIVSLGVVPQQTSAAVSIPIQEEVAVAWDGTKWNLTGGPQLPPTISLTAPANNAVLTVPGDITLSTTVADTAGTVAKVDFYLNTNLVGTATVSPYSITLNNVTPTSLVTKDSTTLSNVNPGQYLVYAKVTDSNGFTAYSTLSWITVNLQSYGLTVSSSGTGSGTVTGTGIDCGAGNNECTNSSINAGTQVTLTATPSSGSVFAGWSGGGCSGTGTTCVVTMNASQTVTAAFNTATAPIQYGDVNDAPEGQVTIEDAQLTAQYVIGLPVSIDIPAAKIDAGSTVEMYDAYLIGEYADGFINTFPVQQLFHSMKINHALSTGPDLSVNSVSGVPGSTVSVSVIGDFSQAVNAIRFSMQFDQNLLTVSSVRVGSANTNWYLAQNSNTPGTVNVGMFNAGSSGTALVGSQQQIAIINFTVNDPPGSLAGSSALTPGNVSFYSNSSTPQSVSALTNGTFTLNIPPVNYALTVNVSGKGTVNQNPNSANYVAGSKVVLTAIPSSSGYRFSSWSGNASGSANPLTLTMNANTTVTANFLEPTMINAPTSILILGITSPANGAILTTAAPTVVYRTDGTITSMLLTNKTTQAVVSNTIIASGQMLPSLANGTYTLQMTSQSGDKYVTSMVTFSVNTGIHFNEGLFQL